MSDLKNKSGREIGDENVKKLEDYIQTLRMSGEALPHRNGKANVTAVALAAKLKDRNALTGCFSTTC